jgi:hypothetical protein
LKQIIGVIYCKSIFCLNTTPFRSLLLQTLHLFLYNSLSLSVCMLSLLYYYIYSLCIFSSRYINYTMNLKSVFLLIYYCITEGVHLLWILRGLRGLSSWKREGISGYILLVHHTSWYHNLNTSNRLFLIFYLL